MPDFGDHAPFIWAAYGIGLAVLLWTALSPVLRRRSLVKQLQNEIESES